MQEGYWYTGESCRVCKTLLYATKDPNFHPTCTVVFCPTMRFGAQKTLLCSLPAKTIHSESCLLATELREAFT